MVHQILNYLPILQYYKIWAIILKFGYNIIMQLSKLVLLMLALMEQRIHHIVLIYTPKLLLKIHCMLMALFQVQLEVCHLKIIGQQ